MDLSNLRPAEGSVHSDNFRRGRGHGSGNGKTAGKGHKGQKARSGAPRPGFEGGQMPLYRRLPKRGFTNRNTQDIVAVKIGFLERLEEGAVVTAETLLAAGIKNIRTKSLGSNNKTNVVLATLAGLTAIHTPEEIAKRRGQSAYSRCEYGVS